MSYDPNTPTSSNNNYQDSQIVTGSSRSGGLRSILATIGILVAAPLVALLLTGFIFQSYEVDGPSMETTLQNGDRLIVWKAPRTLSKVTGHAYVPKRNDVIVFIKRGLYEPSGNKEKQLIKRVIGLPGDRVLVRDGRITIFNKDNPGGYNPDLNHEYSSTISTHTSGDVDLIVAPDSVFVSGDNRPNSLDSRVFGPVAASDIVGKLTIRISPVSKFKSYI